MTSPARSIRPRPGALHDVTALLVRAQSGQARAVLKELPGRLSAAIDAHEDNRAQWLRFVRYAAYYELREHDLACEVAEELIRLAEPFDDRQWQVLGRAAHALSLLRKGRIEGGYDELARAVVLLEELDEPNYTVGHALNAAAIALARLDLYELASSWHGQLVDVAARLRDDVLQTLAAFNGCWLHLSWAFSLDLLGEHAEARQHYATTLATYEAGQATGPMGVDAPGWASEVVIQSQLARIMTERPTAASGPHSGSPTEETASVERLRHSLARLEQGGRDEAKLIGHLGLAHAHADAGELDTAREHADLSCRYGEQLQREPILVARALWERARLATLSAETTPAGETYRHLAQHLTSDRWDERRARVQSFEERLATERVRDEQRRRAAAYLTDPLTGLGNRRLMEIRLPELLVEAEASSDTVVVCFVDIDEFKQVNDHHSHLIGDEVLLEFAHELRAVLSPADVAARFGGDEFVIVLPGHQETSAYALVERLRRRVDTRRWRSLPGGGHLTMSAGFAESWAGSTRTQLLAAADEALLRAKRAGKNRVEVRAHPFGPLG